MRLPWLVLAVAAVATLGCTDVRDFQGTWTGPRVGDNPVLDVGVTATAAATLEIDGIDTHGIRGALSIGGLVDSAAFVSIDGAEADVLSAISFSGSPLRVYLTFVAIPDGGGEALAVIALYTDRRIEVRVLRGGGQPLYAIFTLAEA